MSLLEYYGSDSDGDSGYTSEDEKKRKHEFSSPHERKRKRRRAEDEEEMLVDTPSSSSCPAHHTRPTASLEAVMGEGRHRLSDHTMDTTSNQLARSR